MQRDLRRSAEGLDVVDHRWLAEVAALHRERRADARRAPLALERLDQRTLLAADVGAGTDVDLDVEVEARDARDRASEQPQRAPARQHGLQRVEQIAVFAAQVDQAQPRAGHAAATVMPSNTASA